MSDAWISLIDLVAAWRLETLLSSQQLRLAGKTRRGQTRLRLDEDVRSYATALTRLVGSGEVSAAELLSLAGAQFELKGFTDPQAFGVTRNPWNLGGTPG